MRETWRRGALGLGLVGVVVALTLVVVGAATGYDGNATESTWRIRQPALPDRNCRRGQHQDRQTPSSSRATTTVGSASPRRGGDPDSFDWVARSIDSVEVMAVIVKGGDLANIYYYDGAASPDEGLTPPFNGGEQNPQISHVEFCFDPKEGEPPDADGDEDRQRHVEDPAQLGDRQAGQGGGRFRRDIRRQRRAQPSGWWDGSFTWKVTVTHSQVQTYAVTGTITLVNSGASPSPASMSPTR